MRLPVRERSDRTRSHCSSTLGTSNAIECPQSNVAKSLSEPLGTHIDGRSQIFSSTS